MRLAVSVQQIKFGLRGIRSGSVENIEKETSRVKRGEQACHRAGRLKRLSGIKIQGRAQPSQTATQKLVSPPSSFDGSKLTPVFAEPG